MKYVYVLLAFVAGFAITYFLVGRPTAGTTTGGVASNGTGASPAPNSGTTAM